MKIAKRLLLFAAILVVLVLGAAAAVPFLFKDKILAAVKEEINNSLTAQVDFQSVSLSLFRHFPNVTVGLKNYSVVGTGVFEGISLAKGELAEVEVDLSSFWGEDKPLLINSVHLRKPKVKVYVLEDGRANYNILKEEFLEGDTTETGEPIPTEVTPFEINLEAYSISGGNIIYQDATSDLYVEITGLDHRGAGNFTQDVYDLVTDTKIQALSVRYGSIPYLKEARTDLKATFNVEAQTSKYTLKDNNLRINDMELTADGFVQLFENDDIGMDLVVKAPENDFKDLLSLIPNAYIEGYEDVKAGGRFEFQASAKGIYNGEREEYPAFDLNLAIADGDAQYPGMPLALEKIQAEMRINSPGSDLDLMTVNVSRFGLLVGKRPFDMIFHLQTPISDPDVDAKIKGEIHLGELAQAFPMDGLSVSGIIDADVRIKTRMSFIDKEQYDRVDMSGKIAVQDLKYKADDMPPVHVRAMSTRFTPQRMEVDRFDAKLGKSDLQAKGHIRNILAYFSPKKTMYGDLSIRSNFFDLNEWMPEEEQEEEPVTSAVSVAGLESGDAAAATAIASSPVFDRFDFTLDGNIRELVYSDYRLLNTYAEGNVKPNRMEIKNAGFLIGDSDVKASGTIVHMFDYLFDGGVLGGNLKVRSKLMNLNQFMEEAPGDTPKAVPSSAGDAAYEPILVPENIRMTIDADIDRLVYTDYELNNMNGTLLVEDQTIVVQDATAGFLGGKVGLTGGYDTRNPDNPLFNMKYDMRDMSFKRIFEALNTFKMLSPLAGYLDGNFNTSLIMDGKLGKDMMPELSSLNVQGFLETLNGVISNFKPFKELGNMLDVEYLKDNIRLTNTKNWFEIKNGIVELKEFDYKYKDIDMKISGSHALMQDMHYKIKARIPRKLLEKNVVGATASRGYDLLRKEASKFGVNIQQNAFVNVMINITGSTTDPKVALNLLGADGDTPVDDAVKDELQAQVDAIKDEAKQQVDQKIEEGKQMVKDAADKAIDSAKTVVGQQIEEAGQKAVDAAKDKLGDAVGSSLDSTLQKKAGEIIDKNKEAERIKNELEKFNPLKKKKDGG
ncbi:MAG: hypothetical protein KF852_18980 [Saprospiraceae bacterium]|nr:hypothetical protein [Saprospiraceae bacterium]